jgi:hypothetical protein
VKLLVIGDFAWHNGSSHVIAEYMRHGPSVGIEVAVSSEFGSRDDRIMGHLRYCDDLRWATHLLVVCESRPLLNEEELNQITIAIPRHRRAVIDTDGHWASSTEVDGDNNAWPCGRHEWLRSMSEIADLILQPSLSPPAPGAVPFPYFGMPEPAVSAGGNVDVQYIGSNWFRSTEVIEVFSDARSALGSKGTLRVCGTFWDGSNMPGFEVSTRADTVALKRLQIEVRPPVPFGDVVQRMGDATTTPVLVRRVLSELELITPRMFETAAADTIPVYRGADAYIGQLYQDEGCFCLGNEPQRTFAAIREDTDRFRAIAADVRARLLRDFSYPKILRQLRDLIA